MPTQLEIEILRFLQKKGGGQHSKEILYSGFLAENNQYVKNISNIPGVPCQDDVSTAIAGCIDKGLIEYDTQQKHWIHITAAGINAIS